MNQSKDTAEKSQIKLHQNVNRFKNVIYKPEMKFLFQNCHYEVISNGRH
jgi:hypothetical protein